jgi:hypothetical protein
VIVKIILEDASFLLKRKYRLKMNDFSWTFLDLLYCQGKNKLNKQKNFSF